jgi:hypothetical protein
VTAGATRVGAPSSAQGAVTAARQSMEADGITQRVTSVFDLEMPEPSTSHLT